MFISVNSVKKLAENDGENSFEYVHLKHMIKIMSKKIFSILL